MRKKKYVLTFLALLLCLYVKGQTNTFPSSGNVGIGTTNPNAPLDVRGTIDAQKFQIVTPSSGSWFNISSMDGSSRLDFNRVLNGDIPLMSILVNGKVGIGTQIPETLLHLKYSTTSEGILVLQRSSVSSANYIRGKNSDGTNAWFIGNGSTNDDTYFRNYLNGKMYFGTGGRNDVAITNNGYVGVGTNTPSSLLEVNGSNAGISISDMGSYNYLQVGGRGLSSGKGFYFKSTTNNTIQQQFSLFVTDGSILQNRMAIARSGNVGIGVTTPSEKLVVDGKIIAEEVKVQNVPSSDYVFGPQYELRPLTEVENYIKENQHLPDIPSAEEFKENGVGLGEMDDMLLRKVEELVLYTINQQKELDKLKKENEFQSRENEELRKELNDLKNQIQDEK